MRQKWSESDSRKGGSGVDFERGLKATTKSMMCQNESVQSSFVDYF